MADHLPLDLLASPNLVSAVVLCLWIETIAFSPTARLCLYDVTQSRVTLTAQRGSEQHQTLVCTKLVEPFQAQMGSLYTVLGELEHQQGKPGPCTQFLTLAPEWSLG